MNAKKQTRRQRALARFTIRPIVQGGDKKAYAAYVQRKEQELAALKGQTITNVK
jgi:hypothetical protein